jgi:hypothetical protein
MGFDRHSLVVPSMYQVADYSVRFVNLNME